MSATPTLMFEATDADFEHSVIDASHAQPVLVDFWADWCQPCKMLMPVLSRVVEELGGQVLLAKVNTDEQQQLAMRMGIRSLPTVRLFKDGRAVAEFMGAQPEQSVRQFLSEHLGAAREDAGDAAREAIASGDLAGAEQALRDALAANPMNSALSVELASLLLADERPDDAEAVLDEVAADEREGLPVRRLRGKSQFIRRALGIADRDVLEARLARSETGDDASLHDGAALRVTQGRFEEALDLLLRLLIRNRAFRDDAARRDMLAIFLMLGGDSVLVKEYRRKMSSALF